MVLRVCVCIVGDGPVGGGSVRGRVPVGVPLRWVCVCCVGGTWLRSLLLCFFECRVPRQNTDSPPLVEAMCEHSSRAFDPVATLAVRTLVVPPSPCARARNMAHTCATRPRAAAQPAWPHTCSLCRRRWLRGADASQPLPGEGSAPTCTAGGAGRRWGVRTNTGTAAVPAQAAEEKRVLHVLDTGVRARGVWRLPCRAAGSAGPSAAM